MIFDQIIDSFYRRLEAARERPVPRSKVLYWELMKEYFERAARTREEGRPLAWMGGFFPLEVLHALDIAPFFPDQFAIQMVAQGKGAEFFETGERYGYSKESCATHIATVGLVRSGMLPAPDIILGSSACDSFGGLVRVLMDMCPQVPNFFLSFPYRRDEVGVAFLVRQIARGIELLEGVTGKRLDRDRMHECIENSVRAFDYTFRINELRKAVPTPIGGREAYSAFAARMCTDGLPKCLAYFEAHCRELEEKAARGEGALPEERHRLFFYGAMPFWNMRFLDWVEQNHHAAIVADMISCAPRVDLGNPTEDPLGCMARKMLFAGPGIKLFNGPIASCIDDMIAGIRDYRVDAAIYLASFGCKQTCAIAPMVAEEVRQRTGLPTLILDIDSGRPEIVSQAQMEARVDQYFAMLEGQRSASAKA